MRHAERVEHLGRAVERDPGCPLTDSQCGKKDGNQPVLPPWQATARVPCHLENEFTVPALVEQAAVGRPFYGQSTQDERTRGEPEVLSGALPLQPDTSDGLSHSPSPFRDGKLRMNLCKERPDSLETAIVLGRVAGRIRTRVWLRQPSNWPDPGPKGLLRKVASIGFQ